MRLTDEDSWVCDNCQQINEATREVCKHCDLYREHGTFESHDIRKGFDPDSAWDGPDFS